MAFLFSQPQQENGTFQSADEKQPFLSHCWSYEPNRPGLKWTHFDILATGQSDTHCKIKEILLTSELKPALNENVGIYISSGMGSIGADFIDFLCKWGNIDYWFFMEMNPSPQTLMEFLTLMTSPWWRDLTLINISKMAA